MLPAGGTQANGRLCALAHCGATRCPLACQQCGDQRTCYAHSEFVVRDPYKMKTNLIDLIARTGESYAALIGCRHPISIFKVLE
jgi:hypothetical protein